MGEVGRPSPWIRSWHLTTLSAILHLALLFYADHIDSHPDRYGGLKYTDVDWRVVMDGARTMFKPGEDDRYMSKGWLGRWMWEKGLMIGDPYNRQTFRYTPLLPILTSPSLIHPLLGKLLLSIISLSVPSLLLLRTGRGAAHEIPGGLEAAPFWPTHLIWTLNPFVLNITTRGSPEAIIVFLVILTFTLLRLCSIPVSKPPTTAQDNLAPELGHRAAKSDSGHPGQKYEAAAAVIFALAISYKIYPVIYVPAIWAFLRNKHGLLGIGIWRFGATVAATLALVNGTLWSIWGEPFLEHTFLYHLHRKDHRHNFSPYFYPIYLSFFSTTDYSHTAPIEVMLRFLRHPLASFLPQATLVLGAGWVLTPVVGLSMAMFVQTVAFVIFNRVCTSQYYMWFLALIPPIMPQLNLTPVRGIVLVGSWVLAQALWLGMAYRLELLAQDAYLAVWAAGIGLFGVSVWVLGEIIGSCKPPRATRTRETGVDM